MSKVKIIILVITGIIVLSLAGFGLIGYYAEKTEPIFTPPGYGLPEIQKQQETQEIVKIYDLVQKAIETGEKEPLITISADGFSQDEIKIDAGQFISFYNSLDKQADLEFSMFDKIKTLGPGITSSVKFSSSGEVRIGDKVLEIYVE